MPMLIAMGLLAGLFFSATFILNRVMSLAGGHWLWSACLRYAYMIAFLVGLTLLFRGGRSLARLLRLFVAHLGFWITAGSIGFGGFYALICFSADHAPGWVVAATWQLTIIASLVVLVGFGRRFPKRIWCFSALVFVGVVLVNIQRGDRIQLGELLLGALPVVVAAFCYPIGNQLVWEARNGNRRLPDITHPLVDDAFNKVLLLSLGSVPFWLLLLVVLHPPPPSKGQLINTALVALSSGIIATSLFLLARSKARHPSQLAAVDATQSSEVIFAMAGEWLLLGAPLPTPIAGVGILLVFTGLLLFIRHPDTGDTDQAKLTADATTPGQ
ncbi:MAG: multidrug resistance efflux transporter family protein [Desulfosarcinaceae bacterium]|nr:multidrug resistance efflux transporter family protein [Desulfosarcinaceae bacterium]